MIRNHLSVRTSVTGAAYHLFRKVSKREADHFIHIMKTGEGRASDPWHKLRERYALISREYKWSGIMTVPMLHLAFQAWNAARNNDKNPSLKLNFEAKQADFPRLI